MLVTYMVSTWNLFNFFFFNYFPQDGSTCTRRADQSTWSCGRRRWWRTGQSRRTPPTAGCSSSRPPSSSPGTLLSSLVRKICPTSGKGWFGKSSTTRLYPHSDIVLKIKTETSFLFSFLFWGGGVLIKRQGKYILQKESRRRIKEDCHVWQLN